MCVSCGKVQPAGEYSCPDCGGVVESWPYVAYTPLAEDIGLDRLAPNSVLTRELEEPLRELAGNHCPGCGSPNRPGALFCAQCGLPMRANGHQAHAPGQVAARVEGPGQLSNGALLRGRYRIVRKIAQGGMGAVYEVRDEQEGGRRLAIKEMAQTALSTEERTQALKDFLREATILATLDHPNLPSFDGVFGQEGNYYLAMEFVQGYTLEAVIGNARDFLPEQRVIVWAAQLCSVLEYLHGQDPPVIYRDCKPGNIMVVDGTDHIKLIDFGIARFHRKGKVNDSVAFGTAGYAPPEQYGNAQTDERSDIYALGATLHHLLTGHDPGDNPFHWKPARYYNPRVSRRVDQAVMRAVNLKPEERFQTIGEFALALGLQPRAETVPLASVSTAATRAEPVPEKPLAAVEPEIGRRLVRKEEPKPQAPDEPGLRPRLAVSESEINLGMPGRRARKGKRLNVLNVGGGELKGIVHTTAPWLAVSPKQLAGNTAEVVVTAGRKGLKTGPFEMRVPSVFGWLGRGMRGWRTRLLLLLWIAFVLTQSHYVGVESFSGALLLAVLGGWALLWLAQITLWLVARHVRILVPAPRENAGQVVIDSNGGTRRVTVRVLARPAGFRVFLGWLLTAAALASEAALISWLLAQTVFR